MNQIQLNEVKKIALEILLDIHSICESNNIRYYLAGGTLLGAIRHKGFIPWDDDIDIIMPRSDYLRFIEIFKNNHLEHHSISSIYNNKKHTYTYTKVYDSRTIKIEKGRDYKKCDYLGIDIDVFPIDGLPQDYKKASKIFKVQKFFFNIHTISVSSYSSNPNILKRLLYNTIAFGIKLIGPKFWITNINKRAEKYDFDQSIYVGASMVPYYGIKERLLRSDFIERELVEFENQWFWAPKKGNVYLTNLYGNYMTLPPIEKRRTHHENEVYWKSEYNSLKRKEKRK